jgi:PKD repeat protein
MALSFAGRTLPLLPVEHEQWFHVHHSMYDLSYSEVDWSAFGLQKLPMPQWTPIRTAEVGTLVWPYGMSRYGFFYGVVGSASLAAIRTALGDGSAGPANLILSTGASSRIASLLLSNTQPLAQIETGNEQCHLIFLADRRYHLLQNTGQITSTPASWSALLSDLASQLGISLTIDSIHADYDVPTDLWLFDEKPLSPILDAVCNRIGHRLIANLDGTFSTVSVSTASAAQTLQAAGFTKMAGGFIPISDLVRSAPASVKVVFRDSTGSGSYTVTKTLAGLALTEYGTATGVSGAVHTITGEPVYDGSNATALDDYATQAATDHYLWHLTDADVTYAGIVPWTPCGSEDWIEWTYRKEIIKTRVLRRPFQVPLAGSTTDADDSPVTYGCTITTNEDDEVIVDVDELAGDGLVGNTDDDCHTLEVATGCGLTIDGDGALAVDTDALAGDGLVTAGDCELAVNVGCGLEISSDAVRVKASDLAGAGLTAAGTCMLDVNVGCGLQIDGLNNVAVDVGDFAGGGLIASGACVLDVNPGPGIEIALDAVKVKLGCGLDFDEDLAVQIDGGDLAGDGLSASDCQLNVNLGCGLEFDGDNIKVDIEQLHGDPESTGLTAFDDCTLSFDTTIDSTEDHTLQTDSSLAADYCTGDLVLSKTRQTVTDRYNAAGVLVDKVYGTPTTDTYTVNICHFIECCTADPITLDVVTDPTPPIGSPPDFEVEFNVTPSGGVGPYTYAWDFDDGGTSTSQNPTHTFAAAGTYEVTITVTDSCDCEETETVIVYVITPPGCDCSSCPDGAPLYYTFTLSGGTGDFAGANGDYIVPYVPDSAPSCSYSGGQNGWSAGVNMVPGAHATVTVFKFGDTPLLDYETSSNADGCCDTFVSVPLDDSVGTGTPPTLANLEAVDCGECGVETGCCPDDPVPTVLTVTATWGSCFSCLFPGLPATFDITYQTTGPHVGKWYSGVLAGAVGDPFELYVVLECIDPDWQLSYPGSTAESDCSTVSCPETLSPSATACDPFSLTFPAGGTCGTCGSAPSFVVSE